MEKGVAGVREMAQWFRELAAFPEALSLIPNSHVRWLTAVFDSSYKEASGP